MILSSVARTNGVHQQQQGMLHLIILIFFSFFEWNNLLEMFVYLFFFMVGEEMMQI